VFSLSHPGPKSQVVYGISVQGPVVFGSPGEHVLAQQTRDCLDTELGKLPLHMNQQLSLEKYTYVAIILGNFGKYSPEICGASDQ
jgi:hypothetical protein